MCPCANAPVGSPLTPPVPCPGMPRTFVDKTPRERARRRRRYLPLKKKTRVIIIILKNNNKHDCEHTHRQQTRFPLWSVVSWQLAVTLFPTVRVDATRIPLCITTTHRCLLTTEEVVVFFFFSSCVKTVRLDSRDPPLLNNNVKGAGSQLHCVMQMYNSPNRT